MVDRDIATQILMNMPEEEILRFLQYGSEMMGGGPRYKGVEIAEKPQEYTQMPDTMGEDLGAAGAGTAAAVGSAFIPVVGPFIAPLVGAAVGAGTKAGLREATGSADQARKAMFERGGDYDEMQRDAAMRGIAAAGLRGAIGGGIAEMGAAEEAGTGLASQAAANSTIPGPGQEPGPLGVAADAAAQGESWEDIGRGIRERLSTAPIIGRWIDPPAPPVVPPRAAEAAVSGLASPRRGMELHEMAALNVLAGRPDVVGAARSLGSELQAFENPPVSTVVADVRMGAKPKKLADLSRLTEPPVQPPVQPPSVPPVPSVPVDVETPAPVVPAAGFGSRALQAATIGGIFDPPPEFPMSEEERAAEARMRAMAHSMGLAR
jgi:hypothetical protein